MEKFDVVIVGGGLIGQSLALALSNFKLEVGLVDLNFEKQLLSKSYDNRVSAIVPSTVNFLKAIGIWGNIHRKRPYQSTRVWDQNSNGKLNFSSKNDELGFIIENNQIIHALHEATECCSNIKIINSEVNP